MMVSVLASEKKDVSNLPSFSRRKVKTTFETPFNKANSAQGGGFRLFSHSINQDVPVEMGIHMVSSKFQRVNCPSSCTHQSSTVKRKAVAFKV